MFIKLMTVENFFDKDVAKNLSVAVSNLKYIGTQFGEEIPDFNMVSDDCDKMFTDILNKKVIIDKEVSGTFCKPKLFIHFESFSTNKDWCFAVALEQSMFNVYEHKSGSKTALEKFDFNYRNLFEWNLVSSNFLYPGQAIFYRPWLFHSFDSGMIQKYRLKEEE